MNLFQVKNKLYTSKDCRWIEQVDTKKVSTFVIFKFISFDKSIPDIIKKLNSAVFRMEDKHFLYYAWSLLPKTDKAPSTPYYKKRVGDKWDWLLDRYADYLEVGNNDIEPYRELLVKSIEDDTATWFKFFGVETKLWKKYKVDTEDVHSTLTSFF